MNTEMQKYIEDRSVKIPFAGCWIWEKSIGGPGYGDFRINKKHYTAHRASYEAFNGDIPAGLHVMHECDCKACVNPEHLRVGTNKENIADSVSKGRRKGITRNRPSGLKYNWTCKPGPKPKVSYDK